MYMVGLRDTDVFQNTSGYGMFTGGLGFQYGAEKLGALTVPAAAGNTKRQIKFITDFGTTCLHIIPSYATRLAEVMYEEGIDPRKIPNYTPYVSVPSLTRKNNVNASNSFWVSRLTTVSVCRR